MPRRVSINRIVQAECVDTVPSGYFTTKNFATGVGTAVIEFRCTKGLMVIESTCFTVSLFQMWMLEWDAAINFPILKKLLTKPMSNLGVPIDWLKPVHMKKSIWSHAYSDMVYYSSTDQKVIALSTILHIDLDSMHFEKQLELLEWHTVCQLAPLVLHLPAYVLLNIFYFCLPSSNIAKKYATYIADNQCGDQNNTNTHNQIGHEKRIVNTLQSFKNLRTPKKHAKLAHRAH